MFDPTLNGLMAQVEAGKIVLPAMQRPFVWKEDRITKLIDSLLRGFPIGTALLWKTSTMQRFRRIEKDVRPDAGITVDFDSDRSTERYLVLDGQQRLTSLFVAITGTYDGRKLFVDALSGVRGDRDPGDAYWDCRFLTEKEATDLNAWPRPPDEKIGAAERAIFIRFQDLTRLAAARAGVIATQRAAELRLDPVQTARMTVSYLQGATVLASKTALQIHLIDEDASEPMPIEEILEVFVRVNSGGLVLQKSDLLMSLLDLKWNDIQPACTVRSRRSTLRVRSTSPATTCSRACCSRRTPRHGSIGSSPTEPASRRSPRSFHSCFQPFRLRGSRSHYC